MRSQIFKPRVPLRGNLAGALLEGDLIAEPTYGIDRIRALRRDQEIVNCWLSFPLAWATPWCGSQGRFNGANPVRNVCAISSEPALKVLPPLFSVFGANE